MIYYVVKNKNKKKYYFSCYVVKNKNTETKFNDEIEKFFRNKVSN